MARALFTKAFWADTAERAIKTAAQSGLGVWGANAFTSVGAQSALLVVAIATGASVLTSIASAGVGDDSASLIR